MISKPRLPRDDVNVTPHHQLKEGAVMLLGVIGVVAVVFGLAVLLVDRIVPHIPQSWERWLFPDFEAIRLAPETDEERAQQQALESLMVRLVAHWPDHPEAIRVGLLDTDVPNALAFPGGLILVTTELLRQVKSENELAFVLGHELGHYRDRDHLRSLGRGVVLGLIAAAIGRSGAVADIALMSSQLTTRSFSRAQEGKADAFGLGIVEAEFGHVNGATNFFEHLPEPDTDLEKTLATYLATHPLNEERVLEMERLAGERGWSTKGDTIPLGQESVSSGTSNR